MDIFILGQFYGYNVLTTIWDKHSYSEIGLDQFQAQKFFFEIPCVPQQNSISDKSSLFEAAHLQASFSVKVTVPGFVIFLQDSGLTYEV